MSIDEALSILESGVLSSIQFSTMEGEIRTAKVRYGGSSSTRHAPRGERNQTNKQKKYTFRDGGTIPLTDVENNRFISPKWFSLLKINNIDII